MTNDSEETTSKRDTDFCFLRSFEIPNRNILRSEMYDKVLNYSQLPWNKLFAEQGDILQLKTLVLYLLLQSGGRLTALTNLRDKAIAILYPSLPCQADYSKVFLFDLKSQKGYFLIQCFRTKCMTLIA